MEIPRHWRLKKQRYGLVGETIKDYQDGDSYENDIFQSREVFIEANPPHP